MTNAELIAKIKAEIKRRRDSYLKAHSKYGRDADYIAATEDLRLLEFLDTLESEKPKKFEDELKDYLRRYYNCDYPKQLEENTCSPTIPHIVGVARHFAEWGAEHAREQMMEEAVEVQNVVEEGRYCQEIGPIFLDERAGFKPGDKVRVIVLPKDDEK